MRQHELSLDSCKDGTNQENKRGAGESAKKGELLLSW